MSDAIKKLHDYLAKSPSVVYPEDVFAYLPAIEDENAKLRELVRDFDKCLDTALYLAGCKGFATMPDQELFSSLHPRMMELGVCE